MLDFFFQCQVSPYDGIDIYQLNDGSYRVAVACEEEAHTYSLTVEQMRWFGAACFDAVYSDSVHDVVGEKPSYLAVQPDDDVCLIKFDDRMTVVTYADMRDFAELVFDATFDDPA